jgi:hypothetical protein
MSFGYHSPDKVGVLPCMRTQDKEGGVGLVIGKGFKNTGSDVRAGAIIEGEGQESLREVSHTVVYHVTRSRFSHTQ